MLYEVVVHYQSIMNFYLINSCRLFDFAVKNRFLKTINDSVYEELTFRYTILLPNTRKLSIHTLNYDRAVYSQTPECIAKYHKSR